jgi:hypothetical protein
MDLLDVAIEEGYNEQDKYGEEVQKASELKAEEIRTSNLGKAPEAQEKVSDVYKYPGSGMSIPTETSFRSSNPSQKDSLERLKKLLPIIPGK